MVRSFLNRLFDVCMFVVIGILSLSTRVVGAAEQVHFSDFDEADKISNTWSVTTTTIPAADDPQNGNNPRRKPLIKKKPRRFLGEFANETVSLSLKSLPKHDFVRVSFDLLILKQWQGLDGNGDTGVGYSAHSWGMQMDEGPLLLHSAFSNMNLRVSPRQDNRRQTFPTLLPGERVAVRSRAVENNTLGYADAGGDSIYKMKFLIPHEAATVRFNFFGENLSQVEEMSWGLDNVRVEVLAAAEVPVLDAVALKDVWEDLAGADPMKAYDAGWKMIASPDVTLEQSGKFLSTLGVLPAKKTLQEKVQSHVKLLDANEFRARERATKNLIALGPPAVPFMRRELRSSKSPEARSRLELLLVQIDDIDPLTLDEDSRRRERLSAVLGIINNGAAQRLLDQYYPDR